MQVLPPEAFYPIHWRDVAAYTGLDDLPRQVRSWATLARAVPSSPRRPRSRRTQARMRARVAADASYAVHLWNRKAAELRICEGSLYHELLTSFVVLPVVSGEQL